MTRGGEVLKAGPEEDGPSLDSFMYRNIIEVDSNLDRSNWEKCDEVEENLLSEGKGVLKIFWVVFFEVDSELYPVEVRAISFKERESEEGLNDDKVSKEEGIILVSFEKDWDIFLEDVL